MKSINRIYDAIIVCGLGFCLTAFASNALFNVAKSSAILGQIMAASWFGISWLFGVGGLLWLNHKYFATDFWQLKWRIKATHILVMLGGLGAILVVRMIWTTQTAQSFNDATLIALMNANRVSFGMTIMDIVFLAPIIEELYFRQTALAALAFLPVWERIILTSVLFGMVHASFLTPDFVVYSLLGAILALVFIKTKNNLASVIVVHMIANGVALLW